MKDDDVDLTMYKKGPINLLSFVDKYVLLQTKHKFLIHGYVEAIDPITESIIITTFSDGKSKILLLMGHTVDTIETREPEGCHQRIANEIKNNDTDTIVARKQAIQHWLAKNLLPVVDVNGILQVHSGQLCITPPYGPEDCVSNNTIILARIQHLLNNMPKLTL